MISKHISYKEATYSNTATRRGIDNTPDEKQLTLIGYMLVMYLQKRIEIDAY